MGMAKLKNVLVEEFETNIWLSPNFARQDSSQAQVWYDTNVEKGLGKPIDKYGMKYPVLLIFSGVKVRCNNLI